MDGISTLQSLGGGDGKTIEEWFAAVVKTAEEVVETGRPGTVTLTVRISTTAQGNQWITLAEQVGRSSPKKPPYGAALFAFEGDLHRADPRQTKMEFHKVDSDPGEIRRVDDVVVEERKVNG